MDPLRMNRRQLALASLGVAGAVGLAACSRQTLPGQVPEGSRELKIGASDEPQTMDFTRNAAAAIPQVLLYNVLETLVKLDGEGKLRPWLASSWTISEDRLTYTFTLRSNVHFASGAKLDAAAVAASLDHLRSGSSLVSGDLSAISQVSAEGDHAVVLHLSRPDSWLLYSLAGKAGMIIEPDAVANLATRPAGSGPFVFEAHHPGSDVVLRRNEKYWGTKSRIDSVIFRYFTDGDAMNAAMLAGDINVISNLPVIDSLEQFQDTSRFQILEGTTPGEVVMGFNHKTPALQNVLVRQAICHAVDRKAIIDTVWDGHGKQIGSMVSPNDPWYEDLSGTYPHDPARAKALLQQAKVQNLTLRLRVPTLPYAPAAGQLVVSQLKAVGITVKLEELEMARWLDEVYTRGNYDLTIVAHVEPYDIVKWADPKYYWHYQNPAFTALVNQAGQAPPETMTEDLRKAAALLATDAVADFLALLPSMIITTTDVSGLSANVTSLSFDVTNATLRTS